MPPTATKRPFSQTMPEPAPEPIQGTAIVVINPGSLNLQVGRAADPFPITIPHCIAWKHKEAGQGGTEDPWLIRNDCKITNLASLQKQGLKDAEESVLSRPMSTGEYRQPTHNKQLAHFNNKVHPEKSDVVCQKKWTKLDHGPEYVIGEEAMYIPPNSGYSLRWPMRKGRFNIHPGPGGSVTSIMTDLEKIWCYAIEQLDIPIKDLKHYRAILLIPDIYNRTHVRELMTLLLDRLGFGAALVQPESICATFGAGVPSACVIDVGGQKTTVCCVEDGISQVNTRLCLDYGGSDITRCFHWLLSKASFPYKKCDLSKRMDAIFMQNLKETFCHLDQDMFGSRDYHFQVKHPESNILKCSMRIGDELILAPMAFFHPEMMGLQGKHLVHIQEKLESDPADIFDDDYLVQVQSKQESSARQVAERKRKETQADQSSQNSDMPASVADESQSNQPSFYDEDSVDQPESPSGDSSFSANNKNKKEEDVLNAGLLGLDQAILYSIEKCESDEVKKKMYSCLVVVGGGLSMFKSADSWLQYRVWIQMPPLMRLSLETMDVMTKPKELDPTITCWKGAAVLACLDTTQELWIRKREWKTIGPRLLRERVAFVW